MSKRFARFWVGFGVILILIPLPAVLSKFTNYVLFFPCGFGVCCLLLPWVSRLAAKRGKRFYTVSRGIFLTLFFAFIGYFAYVSGLMLGACAAKTPDKVCDVVILGSGIDGDQPDIMLKRRLDRAAEYLTEHPAANAICCGGKTAGKPYSEAEVMRMYLNKLGIDDSRIYLDEESTSTQENILFASKLLDESDVGSEKGIMICTSNFHVYRALKFAKRQGLGEVFGLPSSTPAHILPAFWIREFFGISRMLILGY